MSGGLAVDRPVARRRGRHCHDRDRRQRIDGVQGYIGMSLDSLYPSLHVYSGNLAANKVNFGFDLIVHDSIGS